jgi:CysZ protein
MILRALSLSIAQLGDKRIIGVFSKSMLITLILCLALGALFAQGLIALFGRFGAQLMGDSAVIHAIAWIMAFALSMLAFRAVAVPVTGFFGDEVVAAIEDKHYPAEAGVAKPARFATSLRLGLASLSRVLIINLIALPAYIFLIFTAIGPLILFMILNAILLGRDLAEMVVVRHLEPAQMKQWLRNHRLDYALLGLIVTGLFLVPFINLLAPLIGAGAAAHLFHGKTS